MNAFSISFVLFIAAFSVFIDSVVWLFTFTQEFIVLELMGVVNHDRLLLYNSTNACIKYFRLLFHCSRFHDLLQLSIWLNQYFTFFWIYFSKKSNKLRFLDLILNSWPLLLNRMICYCLQRCKIDTASDQSDC